MHAAIVLSGDIVHVFFMTICFMAMFSISILLYKSFII